VKGHILPQENNQTETLSRIFQMYTILPRSVYNFIIIILLHYWCVFFFPFCSRYFNITQFLFQNLFSVVFLAFFCNKLNTSAVFSLLA